MEAQRKRRRTEESERNIEEELLHTDEEEEDYDGREEEEAVKRFNNFLQKTWLPLLNTEIKMFGKQTSSKLKEKVKNLEGKVEQESFINSDLADSLELTSGRLHKKEKDFEDLVQEHSKLFEQKNKLSEEKDLLEERLQGENEKVKNGLSKLGKKMTEIENLNGQVE